MPTAVVGSRGGKRLSTSVKDITKPTAGKVIPYTYTQMLRFTHVSPEQHFKDEFSPAPRFSLVPASLA